MNYLCVVECISLCQVVKADVQDVTGAFVLVF